MMTAPSQTEMKKAFFHRDPSYDGIFVAAVRTTGIFCRPSCPARKPKPDHIEFYPTIREALFSGYRPCKRCHPLDPNGSQPEWISTLLSKTDADPATRLRDGQIRELGVDPARVRRHFLRHYGMTFHAYCRGLRMWKALDQIRRGADLDDVALDHGYESNSGFREAFARLFGQPPGKSRGNDCITMTWVASPLGPLVAGATNQGICFLEFTDRRMLEAQLRALRKHFTSALVPGRHKWLDRLKEELAEYFAGRRKEFTVPLQYPGSPFQKLVWEELRRIPHGETRSYEDLARRIGKPGAGRAVGHANGLNRIAILLPCHRVVNKSGELGGYGGGLWRKKFLLELERTMG